MAPRSRSRKAAAAEETTFDPNATVPVNQDFYDSAQEHVAPLDPDGDGSEDDAPNLSEVLLAQDDDDGADPEDDPSASQPLGKTVTGMSQGQQAAQAELKDYLRRRANLEEERRNIAEDIKQLDGEMKGRGYDMKALKIVFKLSELDEGDHDKIREQKLVSQTYARAAGVDEDLV